MRATLKSSTARTSRADAIGLYLESGEVDRGFRAWPRSGLSRARRHPRAMRGALADEVDSRSGGSHETRGVGRR